ncbi:MAG: hypothetical protein LBR16_01520 [Treponema sp.]|jgi:hypothetical protein|nr:hypothetical protein [Treponema sp.]
MIQALFFLKYRSQLSRTRPELLAVLDEAFGEAVKAGGGKVDAGRRILVASFEETAIGRWLNLVILAEQISKEMAKEQHELFGSCLVFCKENPDCEPEPLCLNLTDRSGEHTVWADMFCWSALSSYGLFDWKHPSGCRRLKEWRSFGTIPEETRYPYREKLCRILRRGDKRNTLLSGPPYIGKLDAFLCCAAASGASVPPLVVRFGCAGRGIVCFADALNPAMRAFIAEGRDPEELQELFALQAHLWRERLRLESSPSLARKGRRFLTLLIDSYLRQALLHGGEPAIILSRILDADDEAAALFRQVYGELRNKRELMVMGTCSLPRGGDEALKGWTDFFPRRIRFSSEEVLAAGRRAAEGVREALRGIPVDLCEIAYGFDLLGAYLPPAVFGGAFCDAGFSRAAFNRAKELLCTMGVCPGEDDLRPRMADFRENAEAVLGPRRKPILTLVRDFILKQVEKGELRPCFDLIAAMAELGGEASPTLTLEAVYEDALNCTWRAVENALRDGSFATLVGRDNVHSFRFIFNTERALVYGARDEIAAAFREQPPKESGFAGCKARIMANLAAWRLCSRDPGAATEAIKETFILNQGLKRGAVPSHRLFALVNLSSNRRISDAIDYIQFAMDDAERNGQIDEIVRASYFGASIFFLYGNISKAMLIAARAEDAALAAGNEAWTERCRFLRGRLFFELGRYDDAYGLFEAIPRGPEEGSAKNAMLDAWAFRARIFGAKGQIPGGVPRIDAPEGDASLFRIEAACLAGDYAEAASLSEGVLFSLKEQAGRQDFLFTEQPDWRSGFDQCEHIPIRNRGLMLRLASAYAGLARCALEGTAARDTAAEFSRFIRGELQDDSDPNDAFYYFAYHIMLEKSGASQVDMTTAVSMAFNRLQRRASRIDDAVTRQDFLTRSLWNNALCAQAKVYKLI